MANTIKKKNSGVAISRKTKVPSNKKVKIVKVSKKRPLKATPIIKKRTKKLIIPAIEETDKAKRNRRTSNEYIGRFAKKWYDNKKLEEVADMMYKFMRTSSNFWLKDFAIKYGFSPSMYLQFARENEYFSDVLTLCKAIQESKLIKIGIKGRPQMPIFILKSVHGLTDTKTEVDSTLPEIPNVDDMSPDEVDRIYNIILNNKNDN